MTDTVSVQAMGNSSEWVTRVPNNATGWRAKEAARRCRQPVQGKVTQLRNVFGERCCQYERRSATAMVRSLLVYPASGLRVVTEAACTRKLPVVR